MEYESGRQAAMVAWSVGCRWLLVDAVGQTRAGILVAMACGAACVVVR